MCARARLRTHVQECITHTLRHRVPTGSFNFGFLEGFLPFSLEGAWFGDKKGSTAFHRGQYMVFATRRDRKGCIYKEVNKRAYGVIGKSWEVGRCLTLGCRPGKGTAYLRVSLAPVACQCLWGLSEAFISGLWNEAISFDLVQFKLNSQSNRVPLISWKSA